LINPGAIKNHGVFFGIAIDFTQAGLYYIFMTKKGHMGRCNLWNVKDTGEPVSFPRCPWALDLSEKPFPGREDGDTDKLGGWYWENVNGY